VVRFVLVALVLAGCGASRVQPVAASAIDAGVDAVVDPDDADGASHAAVAARLAALAQFRLPWSTKLDALDPAGLADLYDYERATLGTTAVEADCEGGRHARVGGSGATREERLEDLRIVAGACSIAVGDLLACELAVRERPCVWRGDGLPECASLHACDELVRAKAMVYVSVCARTNCGGDR